MIGRWTAAVVLALLAAAGIGALAGSFNPDRFVLTAVVFAASSVAPLLALAWYLLVAPRTVPEDRNAADNVEQSWWATASSGAFTDLVVLAGLVLAAVSIAGITLDTQLVLLVVVVVALADVTVRYALLERRAAR